MRFLLLLFVLSLSFPTYSQINNYVKPFLDSIVRQFPNVRDIALNQNNSEAYFTAQSVTGDISVIIRVNKKYKSWSEPEICAFSGQFTDLEPFLSPDGLSLYFASNRPLENNSTETKDFDIWYVTRKTTEDIWSQPINIGPPVNSDLDEFYPSITNSRNLYFTLDNPTLEEKDNIYMSKFQDGSYQKPIMLSDAINSDGYEFNAYVSADESFLIYSCYNKEDGYGSGDLYFSKRNLEGSWSQAKNMGSVINSKWMEYCPFVDQKQILYILPAKEVISKQMKSLIHLNNYFKYLKIMKMEQADFTKWISRTF